MKSVKFIVLMLIGMYTTNIYSQQNQVNPMDNLEIVKRFLEGFNNPAKIQESLNLLADDYKFKNPMVELNSKVEFIALAKEIGQTLRGGDTILLSGPIGAGTIIPTPSPSGWPEVA